MRITLEMAINAVGSQTVRDNSLSLAGTLKNLYYKWYLYLRLHAGTSITNGIYT